MKLYLIIQTKNNGYDTYDGAIVAAPNPQQAKLIHPGGGVIGRGRKWDTWVNDPKDVTAKFIGNAKAGTKPGVILASFNAG